MKRKPYSAINREEPLNEIPEVTSFPTTKWPRWLSTTLAAVYLSKFKRKDGKPSEGAIRNMIYRKQIQARKHFGRIMIDRLQLDGLLELSPKLGGI